MTYGFIQKKLTMLVRILIVVMDGRSRSPYVIADRCLSQVPDMNPDVLRQAMQMGPAAKAELTHQASVHFNTFMHATQAS